MDEAASVWSSIQSAIGNYEQAKERESEKIEKKKRENGKHESHEREKERQEPVDVEVDKQSLAVI